jgi:hypothetical protein
MRERGNVLAWALLLLLLFFWLRLLFHVDPRFPGSLPGSGLGAAAAGLMLVPLLYTVAKRLFRIRGPALRSFLAVHIYAALGGAILALVHTGHKFDNPLGVLLTALMLVVVLSGFVGRYLLQQCSRELSDKRRERQTLGPAFTAARRDMATLAAATGFRSTARAVWLAVLAPWALGDRSLRQAAVRATRIVDAMAALDASIALHEHIQRWFRRWMRVHLTLTAVFYLLLAAHVLIVWYYGLRWLPG